MKVLQVWILFALLCATFVLVRRTRCHVISKQHFGYLLRSIGQIQLIEGQVRLIFHYKLPQMPSKITLRRIHCSEYINMTTLRRRCLNFRQVTYSLYQMRADVLTLLTTRLKEINELLATLEKRPSRHPRSIFTWIGGGLADIFGLAKYKDIENIQQLLRRVMAGTQEAVETWQEGQGLFTRVTKLTNERFQNIEYLLNLSRISILQENRRLEELRDEFLGVYKLIATIINQVHLAIRHTQETEALYLAIQQLNVGHLSHHLLPVDVLAKTLSKMTRQLRRTGSGLRLVHQETDYYYENANVGAAVHSSNGSFVLFIVLYAPVTSDELLSPLTVWQLHPFPLKSPNEQNYYTILATPLKYIAYDPRVQYYIATDNFFDMPLKSDGEITTYIDIHDVSVKLQTVTKRNCALVLFQKSLNDIKQLCGYKIIFNSLPTSVHHLGADRLLLNNVSHLVLSRKARKNVPAIHEKSVTFTTSQVIFQLPCEAIARVLNYVIYSNSHCLGAETSDTLNVTYVMNMPILRHYFSDDLLRDINNAIHLNSTVRAELPPLSIERPDFLDHVEKEDEFAFDFNKAINASVDDEKLYASLSHLIWSKLITNEYLNTFQTSSAFHWLSVLSLTLSAFNTLILLYLFMKYKSINYLLLTLPRVKSQIIYTLPPTPSTTVFSLREAWLSAQTTMTEIWSIELLLILILLCLIIFAVIYFLRLSLSNIRHHTSIRLDLTADNHLSYTRIVLNLPYRAHHYRFDLTPAAISVDPAMYFQRLTWTQGVVITEQPRGLKLPLIDPILLSPFTVRHVRRILRSPYRATLVVLAHNHEIVDILPLYSSAGTGQLNDKRLYPSAP